MTGTKLVALWVTMISRVQSDRGYWEMIRNNIPVNEPGAVVAEHRLPDHQSAGSQLVLSPGGLEMPKLIYHPLTG